MYGYKTYAIITNAQNTLDIIRFGDITEKLAINLEDINAAGRFVRARGGFLGLRKEHAFLGWYQEAFVPCPGYKEPPVEKREQPIRTLNDLASLWLEQALHSCARVLTIYEGIDGLDGASTLTALHDLYVFGHAFTSISSAQAEWFLSLVRYEERARERRRWQGKTALAPERLVTYEGQDVGVWWYEKPSRYVLHYDLDPALVLRLMPIEEARIAQAIAWNDERYGPCDPAIPINRWAARQAQAQQAKGA